MALGRDVARIGRRTQIGGVGGDVSLWFGRWQPSSQAASAEHVVEGFLELPAEAWVDDRVDTTVEVSQPEGDLEDGFRRLAGRED